jgi:hypothetical protein
LLAYFRGGARGGGKTDACLGKLGIKALRYKQAFNGVFFRKEMPQSDDLIERAKEIYLPVGAQWMEQKKQFVFPTGGRLRFRALENVDDAQKYQGQNLTDAVIEEAGNYGSSAPIDRLFGCLRSARGVPIQLSMTANPGGPGHSWLKQRFIDPFPSGMKKLSRTLPSGKKHEYIYIPSRVVHNRILLARDPGYIDRLYLVGSTVLSDAWRYGDWNIIEGSFFPEFNANHIIRPFAIPPTWMRFCAIDWGHARPYVVQWCTIASEDFSMQYQIGMQSVLIPKGAMICYRELYGSPDHSDTGTRETLEEIAAKIHMLERFEPRRPDGSDVPNISYRVIDPSCSASDGGPSIIERLAKCKIYTRGADNKRIAKYGFMGGWDAVRSRLRGDGRRPDFYIFDTCVDLIRIFPLMIHDPANPEDMLKKGMEDHACDCARYAVMSRPFIRRMPEPRTPPRPLNTMTLDELWQEDDKRSQRHVRV